MIENLVIVESPAKAKTIERFLGKEYTVKSSFGHIRDLDKKGIGIDLEHNYAPHYIVSADKQTVVKELKALAKQASTVWLASDEDREGEAIAWHLFEVLGLDKAHTKRIVFHEITKDAILNAIKTPRDINYSLVNAQQARRVLDRLVGFELSPVLWKKVKPALSAGRVQSVAVKLIVEREREINAFDSQKYYKVSGFFETEKEHADLKAETNTRFEQREEVMKFLTDSKNSTFSVADVETKPAIRKPSPPFTTSTIQQEASRKLGFSVSQTMSVAQKLYENGHITYMRTDSVNLSDTAIKASKKVICDTLGEKYSHSRQFTTHTKGAQEAHEAIRPTNMGIPSIKGDKNEQSLYELIYKRTLASQMTDAELERTEITINASKSKTTFISIGEVILFDGFLRVYMEDRDDEADDEHSNLLPPIKKGDILLRKTIRAAEQYTMHPPRYTEASLVKKMEALGIGRPSTYAPTITTIQKREYIARESRDGIEKEFEDITLQGETIKSAFTKKIVGAEKKKLFPSNIGVIVTDFLDEHFPKIMDYNFTAKAEENFDDIACGDVEWQKMIDKFYMPFHKNVESTLEISGRNKGEREIGKDPVTGENVIVRIGRYGPMAQIGEGETVRYAGLHKDQLMETVTLEEVMELFKFPRKLGPFEDKEVVVGIGRFGPYIRHDNKFVSLKKGVDDPQTIDLATAIERIGEKREADKSKYIKEFDNGMQVLNGRFGPYITYEKVNYKIPKTVDAKELTFENAQKIVADAEMKNPKKSTGTKATASNKKPASTKATGTKATASNKKPATTKKTTTVKATHRAKAKK
ncbi:DNA topoisomerase 1 [Bacteroidia bacterium]|nr:DNA topoisomerase 1 [Bacteroidia bacterium]